MNQMSFEQAQALILKNIRVLENERKALLEALGQVAAEAVKAKINVPDWDASALDGFALKSADIKGSGRSNPVILKVIGRVTAGQTATQTVTSGNAIRIMTGAPIMPGSDCVVGFEDSDEDALKSANHGQIGILKAIPAGGNIRRAGEQIAKGTIVLNKGQTIGPGEIGLLASLGRIEVKVIRRPVVAIIATGEELVSPGQPLAEAKIYCGNASALAAQVTCCGGVPKILPIAHDSLTAVRKQIRRGLQYDMILTTGGSSMGDRDLVKEVMAEMGSIIFDQVEMTPGKSSAFAMLIRDVDGIRVHVPHFALSGNPTAAMLSFEVLARPATLKMQGVNAHAGTIIAQAAQNFSNPGGRTRLVWVSLQPQNGVFIARPADAERQGVLQSIAAADGIAVIPPDTKKVSAGDSLQVIPLNWR